MSTQIRGLITGQGTLENVNKARRRIESVWNL